MLTMYQCSEYLDNTMHSMHFHPWYGSNHGSLFRLGSGARLDYKRAGFQSTATSVKMRRYLNYYARLWLFVVIAKFCSPVHAANHDTAAWVALHGNAHATSVHYVNTKELPPKSSPSAFCIAELAGAASFLAVMMFIMMDYPTINTGPTWGPEGRVV